ncbi:MAG TPA: PhaM family polyhydroxyalkanoate granule multifunctional regulatory protein [Rhodocyclaceae bacterium]
MSDAQDPLDFIKNMWGNMGFTLPGMVTPTLDTDELDKRIAELKTVEGWLKTNLGLLQMTVQGLEMQRATLAAMRAMSESAGNAETGSNPFMNPALWQWPFMSQGDGSAPSPETAAPAPEAKPAERPARAARPKKKAQ